MRKKERDNHNKLLEVLIPGDVPCSGDDNKIFICHGDLSPSNWKEAQGCHCNLE